MTIKTTERRSIERESGSARDPDDRTDELCDREKEVLKGRNMLVRKDRSEERHALKGEEHEFRGLRKSKRKNELSVVEHIYKESVV